MDRASSKTIIIPAYNAASTIADTLCALKSCPGIEEIDDVFVYDDASTDETIRCSRDAWNGRPNLTIVSNRRNLGERRTINAAIQQVKHRHEWVLIVHADDVVKKNWLELYLPRMRDADQNVASICSSYDCWYPDSKRIDRGQDDLNREIEVIKGSFESLVGTLKAGCWWHVSGCALRVRSFLEIGGFRSDLPQCGDLEWLLRCLKKGKDIIYIPRTTMLYRMHSKSISSSSFRTGRDLAERLKICRQYFGEGYLRRNEYRKFRCGLAYQAVRRLAKVFMRGKLNDAIRLLDLVVD